MSNFVLVHGAWHAAWCWDRVIPLLQKQGHKVFAPDLPGHGSDAGNPADISLQHYSEAVKDIVVQQTHPVILVGHSMAGIIISRVAEEVPDRIERLVYLSAFMVRDGQSMLEIVQKDTDTLVLPNLVFSRDRKTALVKKSVIGEAFYNDCSPQDVTDAMARLVAQPLLPLSTPVHTSADRWGRVPRAYIKCSLDRALSPSIQQLMIEALPCDPVYELSAGHAPFFSASAELVTCLHKLASNGD